MKRFIFNNLTSYTTGLYNIQNKQQSMFPLSCVRASDVYYWNGTKLMFPILLTSQ